MMIKKLERRFQLQIPDFWKIAKMMKHFAGRMIDEVLDEARATPEQRAKITAARDSAFATMEANHGGRKEMMEGALALFEAPTVDRAQLQALRAEQEARHRKVADAVTEALITAHDVLTPEQRRIVAEYVRSHRPGRE